MPVSSMLRLYRSVAVADEAALSAALRAALLKNLQSVIYESKDDTNIDANMWLSIMDTSQRIGEDEMSDFAKKVFTDSFDFSSLLASTVSKKLSGDTRLGGGRKFNK